MLDAFTVQQLLWAALVMFGAYVVRGMSGFGAGLVATPLLAFMFPMSTVVPVTGLVVFVLFILLAIRDHGLVIWRELKLLALPTLAGVVAGMLLFTTLDNRWLMSMLGCFLIAYAAYMLLVHVLGMPQLQLSERWAIPLGFAGAFADTLFGGGGGTLVVIYMHGRGMGKAEFRATVAMLWFIEMMARISGYALVGYYTTSTLALVALMLPFMLAGTWVGERITNRISQDTFSKILAAMLMLSGASLLAK